MPWMAARPGVPRPRFHALLRVRSSVRRPLVGLLLLAATGGFSASATAQSPVKPVLLPDDASRSVIDGPAGWTSSAQVTATGCGSGSCAVATGDWVAGGPHDGVLRSTVSGVAGHSGQAVVTWRSGLFFAPPRPASAAWTLSVATAHEWAGSSTTRPIYTVRILEPASGTGRTVVDRALSPTPADGWVTTDPIALPLGAIAPSGIYRLEITVKFTLGAATGDALVDLDAPTLTVEQASERAGTAIDQATDSGAAGPRPSEDVAPPLLALPVPDPATTPSPDRTTPNRACLAPDADIALIGVSARDRRLSLAGRAAYPDGTPVELVSVDGWLLGRTAIDASGHFSASVREPRGSAGTRRVFARLADGTRSPAARVQRGNVLRVARRSGRTLVLEGTVDPAFARRGHISVVADLAAADPCSLSERLTATKVTIDRSTGRYRAVVRLATQAATAGGSAAAWQSGPALVRAGVRRAGPGVPRATVNSQVIFGPASDRGGT